MLAEDTETQNSVYSLIQFNQTKVVWKCDASNKKFAQMLQMLVKPDRKFLYAGRTWKINKS